MTDALSVDLSAPEGIPEDVARAHASELHAQLCRLAKKHREHGAHLDMIECSYDAQVEEIAQWREGAIAPDLTEMKRLVDAMRPIAHALCRIHPQHRKSIELPGGMKVQFRNERESIEADAEQLREFAAKHVRSIPVEVKLLRTPERKPEADLVRIKQAIDRGQIAVSEDGLLSLKGDDGERIPIPGVKLVRGEESFTVKAK